MVTRDANEHPGTISGEIQGGRPLHFLRLLSCYPLLDYPPSLCIYGRYSCEELFQKGINTIRSVARAPCDGQDRPLGLAKARNERHRRHPPRFFVAEVEQNRL
jgi:hypothetical protein